MFAYVVRRVFAGFILIIVMSLITFVLFFASPIDPAQYSCGKNCSPSRIEQTRKALGYDKPVLTQWAGFMKGVAVGREYPLDPSLRKSAPELVTHCPPGCLGYSVLATQTVNAEIRTAFPISASLAVAAFLMWIIGGVSLGAIAALRKGTLTDRGIVGVALVFFAFPTFWVGLLLYNFLAIKWGLVPNPVYTPISQGFGLWLSGLLLPALTLALFYMAGYIRYTRAFVLEAMSEDYIRTARAKGLKGLRVTVKHSMRAALTPLLTLAGLDFASLLGGAIITETVFNYPGLGKLAVTANAQLDLPTLVGLVVLLAAFVIVANILVDALYAFVDPRVRLG